MKCSHKINCRMIELGLFDNGQHETNHLNGERYYYLTERFLRRAPEYIYIINSLDH